VSTDQGYIVYLVKVIAPGGHSFHFKDRYSSMRNFQSLLRKSLSVAAINQLPKFPPKKTFGSKDEDFVNQRSVQLQQFFNSFFQNKSVMERQEHLVLQYLLEHAADDQSRQKIEEYNQYR
jgi:hypothetical protein